MRGSVRKMRPNEMSVRVCNAHTYRAASGTMPGTRWARIQSSPEPLSFREFNRGVPLERGDEDAAAVCFDMVQIARDAPPRNAFRCTFERRPVTLID